MLVRVQITNTPFSRRSVRFMIKLTIILALIQLFGLTSLAAVAAYLVITKVTSRRPQAPLTFKKPRLIKKKTDRLTP
jgi:hypothetical protein